MPPEIYWITRAEPARLALMPRPRSGDWLADEISGWARANIGTVVSLLEPHEIRELELLDERPLCETHGIEFLSFPIPDRGTPRSIRETAALIDEIVVRLNRGSAVAVHCRAGIGRSGLIAGCVLIRLGVAPSEVFPALTDARGVPVPDTSNQAEWLELFRRDRPKPA